MADNESNVVPRSNCRFTAENARLMAQRSIEARRQRKQMLASLAAQSDEEREFSLSDEVESVDTTVKRSEKIVTLRLAKELLRQSAVLEGRPPTTVKELKDGRTATVCKLIDMASELYGWGKAPQQATQINFYGQARFKPKTPQ